jgi:hypothetical protein
MALVGSGFNGQVIGGGAQGTPAQKGGVTPGSNLPMNVPVTATPAGSNKGTLDPGGTTPTSAGSEQTICALGAYARSCFVQAMNSRTVIDNLLLQCLRQRRNEYDPGELAAMQNNTILTFFGVTATKCRAGEAWLTDILTASGDRVWSLAPDPNPQRPADGEGHGG